MSPSELVSLKREIYKILEDNVSTPEDIKGDIESLFDSHLEQSTFFNVGKRDIGPVTTQFTTTPIEGPIPGDIRTQLFANV